MTSEGLITAPVGTSLEEAEKILHREKIEKLPVVDEAGRLRGLITVKDIFKRRQFPSACKDAHGRLRVGAAVGTSKEDFDRAAALVDAGVDVLVIDTAHGHSAGVLDALDRIRNRFPEAQIIAGNIGTAEGARALMERGADAIKVGIGPGSICTTRVVTGGGVLGSLDRFRNRLPEAQIIAGTIGTAEGARALMERGADAIKVGIGPGSICTTRVVTGVGVPQLTAVMEAVRGVEGRVPIIADGGIRYSGDIVKAIAAGASAVMVGSLLAGTEESPGESFLLEGRRYKTVRGMGSLSAMEQGSADRYFQDREREARKLVPEGIEARVPYKGPASDVVYQLVGGLRSEIGRASCRDIGELQTKTRFTKITGGGLRESHPHDVVITREAPNYHM